jgi:hypothetical protein
MVLDSRFSVVRTLCEYDREGERLCQESLMDDRRWTIDDGQPGGNQQPDVESCQGIAYIVGPSSTDASKTLM